MKRTFLISLLAFFVPSLFFGATFKDMSFEEFYNQDAKDYVKKEAGFWWDDEDIAEFEPVLGKDFNAKHPVARDFFKSIPEDYDVKPILLFSYDDEGNIVFLYALEIQKGTFNINLFNFSRDESGLHGRATVDVDPDNDAFIDLYFTDFRIQNNGTFESGFSYEEDDFYENCYMGGKGFFINLFKSYLEKADDDYRIVTLLPTLDTEAFYDLENDELQVRLGKTVFDSNGNIVSCEPYNELQGFDASEWTFGAWFTSVIWNSETNSFRAKGKIEIPSLGIQEEFNNYEIEITNKTLTMTDSRTINFNYIGYPMSTETFILNPWKLTTDLTDIHINDKTITLPLTFKCTSSDDEWFLENPIKKEVEEFDHYLCEDDLVLEYLMDNAGLKVTFKSRFPKGGGYMDKYFFLLKPDGSMEYLWSGSEKNFGIGLTCLKAEYITWNSDKNNIYIAYPTFYFPESSKLGPVGFNFKNLYMDMDGNFEITESTYLPRSTTFFDRPIIIDHFEFADDGIIMSGTHYPSENLSRFIAFSKLNIDKLYVGYDGTIKELVSKSDQKNSFYLPGNAFYVLSAKGNHLELEQTENGPKCWLYLDDSKLLVSLTYFSTDSDIQLKNVRFNYDNGEEDYDSIYIQGGFSLFLNGRKYEVSEGKIISLQTEEKTVHCLEFTGDMVISDEEKAPFIMDIDFDGKLHRLQVGQDGKAIELRTLNRIFRLI